MKGVAPRPRPRSTLASSRDGLALAPGLPATLESLDGALRLLVVGPPAERERGELQLTAPLVDLLEQMALVCRVGEGLGAPLNLFAEEGEVVIVTQMVR